MKHTARKIIIDTDPGIDDAMAILLALASPELELIGLSTVFGNVHTPMATSNALRLLEFCGRSDIPVAPGASAPLSVPLHGVASFVHGENGFGGVELPLPRSGALKLSAAEFIAARIMEAPGEVTLVPIGPLTNIALALELQPEIAEAAAGVVLMGGAAECGGNITPFAEANIYHDPHAARRVFGAGWPVTMIGLDVTQPTVMSNSFLESLRESSAGELIYRLSRFYTDFYRRQHGIDGAQTHDPSAVISLIESEIFSFKQGWVAVTLEGEEQGRTCFTPGPGKIQVATGVDSPRLLELFRERILSGWISTQ